MNKQNNQLYNIRHSAEHILAQAILNLYPKALMAMGPATDEGFYGDFEFPKGVSISPEDFPKIEKEMQQIINLNLAIEPAIVSIDKAKQIFKNNPYKQEFLNEIKERNEDASLYYTGRNSKNEFVDLCAGPHIKSTKEIKAFKLISVAGAYWRGDSNNKMLVRIYGTAFSSKQELDNYLQMRAEAEKRDHRKIGKELELLHFDSMS
ncbi:MAG: threonine--tRNA ligase, partial [Proteobacteria bacterium]|nr:threonine--tRNA ligase [Pseudomonadota bacterium]